jgi:hypothetical protein
VLKKNGVGAAAAGSEMVAHSRAATPGIVVIDWFMLFPLLQVVETKGGRRAAGCPTANTQNLRQALNLLISRKDCPHG